MIAIVDLGEMKLIGIRVVCPGDQYAIEIPKATHRLEARLNEISGIVNPQCFVGAYVVEELTEADDGYWVCVEVEEFGQIPGGMVALTIPAQKYAMIRHAGPNTSIRNTYETLHRWEAEHGWERLRSAWHLEISHKRYSTDFNEIEIELYDTIR
ncbi:GyrI-like domain-containing protein [Paenibacillus cymbidii]|uniref:GyrI-like domain-containing protein n=1 Tax=Paenibacillus cymbidii TaxID=1639034 RepID=UPI001436948E|nr:GyrI-like domain-containing protein [Paenibacillus cymbidii]